MTIHRKQGLAMAAIVLAGLLAGAAVLRSGHPAVDGPGSHAEGDAHGHEAGGGEPAHDERHVDLTEAQAQAAGITVETAGPATLQMAVAFQGEIRFDEDRTAHVVPRLAGVVDTVGADLGQRVAKGQLLAVISSTVLAEQRSDLLIAERRRDAARVTHAREKKLWEDGISAQQDHLMALSALQETEIAVQAASQKLAAIGAAPSSTRLNRFELRAPFAGTVVEKHLSLGEAVKEDASIFTVSDLGRVRAEFAVAPQDLARVRVGQRAVVSSTAFEGRAEGRVSYVGALLGEQTRTARARVTLANPEGAWRPGLFVTVSVPGDAADVPIAVSAEAVQTVADETVVFKAAPGGFVATPVQVGRSDGRVVEVLGGLQAGDAVAATKTFVLKSELGKGEAGHGH